MKLEFRSGIYLPEVTVDPASLPSDESPPSALLAVSIVQREGGSRSLTGHRGLGFERGLREPPTSPSPAAGCSLLGFSRASGEFLRSCPQGLGFSSAKVRAGLVGGFCPRRLPLRRHISRQRPESRRIFASTVSDSLFQGEPGGGIGFDVVNSGEPFPPWPVGMNRLD
ncbi:hypothetical protein Cgig2_027928 [Carnegiea gigantea]|uniref:Uncharacterized protein n=1 Tax=Carnegiea gigantea TaxID=171969 RepID=A0A9Q1KNH8_9CARY|nr:hypothetical protein Cgig2_027928 [Carnegiea gigantea]